MRRESCHLVTLEGLMMVSVELFVLLSIFFLFKVPIIGCAKSTQRDLYAFLCLQRKRLPLTIILEAQSLEISLNSISVALDASSFNAEQDD